MIDNGYFVLITDTFWEVYFRYKCEVIAIFRYIVYENGLLRNDDVIMKYLFQVMDEHLPLMEPIYNQYCSNFPLATKYYAEMTKIPYRSTTLTSNGTLRRGDSATLRAPSTLNREIATSSMSLRASVRHSKLFDRHVKMSETFTGFSFVELLNQQNF